MTTAGPADHLARYVFVRVGAGRLLLASRPRLGDLPYLKDTGCTHLVTLLKASEGAEPIGAQAQESGLEWIWLPVPNGSYPTGEVHQRMLSAMPALSALLDDGGSLAIHCSAGIHRTGTVAYGLLRWRGVEGDEAMRLIARMRPETAAGMRDKRRRWGDTVAALALSRKTVDASDNILAGLATADGYADSAMAATTLADRAEALYRLERPPAELLAADAALMSQFSGSGVPSVRELVAEAGLRTVGTLLRAGRRSDAVAVCRGLLAEFGMATIQDPALQGEAAEALCAIRLGEAEPSEAALRGCGALAAALLHVEVPALRAVAAQAMLQRILILKGLRRDAGRLAACGELVEAYGVDSQPEVQVVVANALREQARTLRTLNRKAESAVVLEGLQARLANAREPRLVEVAAQTAILLGVTLAELAKTEEAMGVYDALIARHGNSSEPWVQRVARTAARKRATLTRGSDERRG